MMKSWVRKSIKVGILTAGMLLFTGQAAQADDWNSSLNTGIGNGNQVRVDAQVPIDICGNAIILGGDAQAGCVGGSHASTSGGGGTWNSFFNIGIGNGNQVYVPVQVPIDFSGNAIGAGGDASAWSQGGTWAAINGSDAAKMAKVAAAPKAGHAVKRESARTESSWNSFFNIGIGVGNQVYVPIQVPINICGNAIGAGGDAVAHCKGGADATLEDVPGNWTSSLNIGIGNGNQVMVPIQVPINICGNAIGLLGDAAAGCKGGSSATIGHGHDRHGDHGDHDGYGDHHGGGPMGGGNGGGGHYNGGGNGGGGNGGGGNGGGYSTPVKHKPTTKAPTKHAPTKKAVSKKATAKESLPLVGDLGGLTQLLPVNDLLGGLGGASEDRGARTAKSAPMAKSAKGGGGGSCMDWTSFLNIGIGNGNQVFVPIQIPIDISGNAVAVGGDAAAGSHGGASATLHC